MRSAVLMGVLLLALAAPADAAWRSVKPESGAGSTVIAAMSSPFSAAKIGNCAQAPSGGGAPRILPSRLFGSSLMPSEARPITAKGGLS